MHIALLLGSLLLALHAALPVTAFSAANGRRVASLTP
jgi:hypothetical protein